MVDEYQVQIIIDSSKRGLHPSKFSFHASYLRTFFFSSGSVRLSCEERLDGSAELTNLSLTLIAHQVGEAGLYNSLDRGSRSEPKKFILNEAAAESAAVRE